MWIELTERTVISGVPRQPGYRMDYPQYAATALISQGRAKGVDGPHEGRHQAGYPVGTNPPEANDPNSDPAVKLEEEPDEEDVDDASEATGGDEEDVDDASEAAEGDEEVGVLLEDVDFSQIKGIGPTRAEEILEFLEDLPLETVADLLDEQDLTFLPGVGSSKVDNAREFLENLQ